ncbi:MAG: helix-turn-helix domain-containing protein [Eubacterium sp.]
MAFSYNGLWKLLIDKDMNKMDLMKQVGISSGTVAKMTRGEAVSMSILEKICEKLDCDFGDLVHYIPDKDSAHEKS